MESSVIATFLQEASISIFTVSALVYIVNMFIKYIERQSEIHGKKMDLRDESFREVEKEMRILLTEHIEKSNIALRENTAALKHNTEVNKKIMKMTNT